MACSTSVAAMLAAVGSASVPSVRVRAEAVEQQGQLLAE